MIDRLRDDNGLAAIPADQWKETALEAAANARERLGEGAEVVKSYIVRQPARAVGIALGVGVLLGWLLKRR